MSQRALVGALVVLSGCAPISTSSRIVETPGKSNVVRDAPKAGDDTLVATSTADELQVTATIGLTCVEHDVQMYHRTEIRKRHANRGVTAAEWIGAVALGGAGGFVAAAPQTAIDRTNVNVDPQAARVGGIAGAGLGAIALVAAIIDTASGGTSNRTLTDRAGSQANERKLACGSTPRIATPLVVAIGDKTWPIGTTGSDGRVAFAWASAGAELFDGDAWKTATVANVERTLHVSIDLAPGRAAVAEREWSALATKPTLDAARAYHVRFPGAHDAEAVALIQKLADQTFALTLDAALTRGDLVAAKQILAQWTADAPDEAARAPRAAQVAELDRQGPVVYLQARFETAMALAEVKGAELARFDEAEHVLVELRRIAPDDPRVVADDARFTKRRATVVAERTTAARALAAKARHHARHAELAAATAAIADAKKLSPDDPQVIDAATYVDGVCKTDPKCHPPSAEDTARVAADKAKHDADIAAEKAKREEAIAAAKAKHDDELAAAKAKRDEEAAAAKAKRDDLAAAAKAKADEQAAAEKAKREEAAAMAKAKRDGVDATKAAADKAKRDEEAAAAERKRQEEAAAREAQRQKLVADKLAADKQAKLDATKREAERLAKAEAERKKLAGKKPVVVATRPEITRPEARVNAAMVGVWAARGHAAGGLVTLIFNVVHDGGGVVSILGASGRVLERRTMTWQTDTSFVITGGERIGLRGKASVRGDELAWAGYTWRRVRGRTTLSPGTTPAPANPVTPTDATLKTGTKQ